MTTLTDAEKTSLESLYEYLADSDYADRAQWIGAIDRALGRDAASNALGHILRPRKYRYCESHGAQKALVAATPPGGVLKARNYDHAQVLRSTASRHQRKQRAKAPKSSPVRAVHDAKPADPELVPAAASDENDWPF